MKRKKICLLCFIYSFNQHTQKTHPESATKLISSTIFCFAKWWFTFKTSLYTRDFRAKLFLPKVSSLYKASVETHVLKFSFKIRHVQKEKKRGTLFHLFCQFNFTENKPIFCNKTSFIKFFLHCETLVYFQNTLYYQRFENKTWFTKYFCCIR